MYSNLILKIIYILLITTFIVISCKGDKQTEETVTTDKKNPNCNIFAMGDCLTPFPGNSFLKNGEITIEEGIMPNTKTDVKFPREALSIFDGFSPLSQIIVYFSSNISKETLPGINRETYSLEISSPVQLINTTTKEKIPILAETDYRSNPDKVLIIRPLKRLSPATTYLVILKRNITNGQSPENFIFLRDNIPTENNKVEVLKNQYENYFTLAQQKGISRKDIFLMWDFTTGSDENIIKKNLWKIKRYIYSINMNEISYKIKDITYNPDSSDGGYIAKYIKGEFRIPLFLSTGMNLIKRDSDNSILTKDVPFSDANFYVNIPNCITEGTNNIPVILVGHGFASSAGATLRKTYFRKLSDSMCSIEIAVKWYGSSWLELIGLYTALLDQDTYPIYALIYTVNKLIQAHSNFLLLSRVVKTKQFYDTIGIDFNKIDTNSIYYFGYSNGGIQGGTFAALTNDVNRFVLNVTGGVWSLIFQRYHNWDDFELPIKSKFDDPVVTTELLFISQLFFDFIDPATYAPYIFNNGEFIDTGKKQILLQESYGDPSVTNISTRILARTMGLKGLIKLKEQVYGIKSYSAPLTSAYTQWNSMPDILPPETNSPLTEEQHTQVNYDLSAHSAIKWIKNLKKQVETFYKTGEIHQYCSDSLCNPE